MEPVQAWKVEGEGIPVGAASTNVRFMRDIGLLTVKGRGQYLPTPEAIRFMNAKSVSDDSARPILRGLLANMWFTEQVESLLSHRGFMSEDQLVGELALAAETDKGKKGPALNVVLEYLLYAGILRQGEEGLSLVSEASVEGVGGPIREGAKDLSSNFTIRRNWNTFETDDFQLRIRLVPSALEELTDYLSLVKKKIDRMQEAQMRETKDGGDEEPSDNEESI
ncbi:MAG: hypothetical protein V3U30_04705 [Thermoplasmata archaeon]